MPRCPRCALWEVAHDLAHWKATVESGEVEVLGCARCHGLFIRRDKLALICPTAAHLPDHAGEVALTAKEGAGIRTCPGCDQPPHEIDLVGVPVDFCTHCHGLWLDGSEYDE